MATGLEGVVAADTTISKVFGEEGRLVYRGYEIEDLAANASFEEVCWLLWHDDLPTASELESLRREFAAAAPIGDAIVDVIRHASMDAHPMATLRTAASALSFTDADAEDMSEEANRRKAIRITAQIATISAAIDRIRNGREPVAPDPELGMGANFLYMLTGERPGGLQARIVDAALTLHAEHGLNASTFAARVTAATLSDMHSSIVSAIGTLKGPLHGGANEQVMAMLKQIGSPDRAEAFILDALEKKQKVMGFGHRVYRTTDPRAPILRDLSERLGSGDDDTPWLDISERVVEVMRREMDARRKQIYPNVDFFSASVYYTLGIPTDLFTNVFAMARSAGWTAHVLEQYANNRLIRPKAEYQGPHGRKVAPIDQRA